MQETPLLIKFQTPLIGQRPSRECRDWGIQDGDTFVVSGSLPQLGNWQQNQPLLLSEVQTPFWETEVNSPSL